MKERQRKQQHALVRRPFEKREKMKKERKKKKTGKKCRMKLLVQHRTVSAIRCVVHERLAFNFPLIPFMQPVAWPQPRLKGARKKKLNWNKKKKNEYSNYTTDRRQTISEKEAEVAAATAAAPPAAEKKGLSVRNIIKHHK